MRIVLTNKTRIDGKKGPKRKKIERYFRFFYLFLKTSRFISVVVSKNLWNLFSSLNNPRPYRFHPKIKLGVVEPKNSYLCGV